MAKYTLLNAVFQDINVYALSLSENVALSENTQNDKVQTALERAGLNADEFPQGLGTILRKDFDPNGVDLSGGQKQSLAIARAYYSEDRLVTILDEPTAALDPIAESRIYEQLDNLIRGRNTVFISHRMASTRFCDEILVLNDGKIAEHGSHTELMDA